MLRAIAFGLAVGAGVQAWRQLPPSGPVTADAAALVLVVAVVCAYLGGRARRGAAASASATAVASAEATAHNTVNLAVVVPGAGREAVVSPLARLEDASWFGTRREVTADNLDGIDLLEELLEREETDDQGR